MKSFQRLLIATGGHDLQFAGRRCNRRERSSGRFRKTPFDVFQFPVAALVVQREEREKRSLVRQQKEILRSRPGVAQRNQQSGRQRCWDAYLSYHHSN